MDNRIAIKAGTWYIISLFLTRAASFLSTPVYTRLLSVNDFGITNTYMSYISIFTILGTCDIYSCIQIAKFDYKEEELDSFLSSTLILSSITSAGLYCFIKAVQHFNQSFVDLPPLLLEFMFLEILIGNAFTLLQTMHRARFKYKEFVFLSAFIAVLSPIAGIISIKVLDDQLYIGKIVGSALPKILISFGIFIMILYKGKCIAHKNDWQYALEISVPLIPHHLSSAILNHFDKIMIMKYSGMVNTGIYSLAYTYSGILSIFWSSVNQAWTPWFYEKMKEDKIEEIKIAAKIYGTLFLFFFSAMVLLLPEAIYVLGGEEYEEAVSAGGVILLGLFFQFIYGLYVNIEYYYKKTQYIAIGTVIASLANIVLNHIFIPKIGYQAAAFTTLISYFIMMVIHYKVAGNWEKRELFDKKFLLILICIAVIITFVSVLFLEFFFLRVFFLLAFLFFIWMQRKRVKSFWRG